MPKPWRHVPRGVPLAVLFWALFDGGAYVGVRPAPPPAPGPPPPAVVVAPLKAEAALDRLLPKVDFDGVPLNRALEAVGDLAGTPVILRYGQIRTPNMALVNCEVPVTLHARDATLGQVIRDLTDRGVPPPGQERWLERLAYAPAGDVIIVSTWGDLAGTYGMLTRAFDVRDLTRPGRPPEALARLVRENVAPGSRGDPGAWDAPGRLKGSIRCAGGRLVLTQDWHVLRQTDQFLAGLRQAERRPPAAAP